MYIQISYNMCIINITDIEMLIRTSYSLLILITILGTNLLFQGTHFKLTLIIAWFTEGS